MNKIKLTFSSAMAATLTVAAITAVTVWSELSPAFKNFLADFTGHHWLTKSALSLLVYFGGLILIYFYSRSASAEKIRNSLILLISSTLIGSLILFLFYLWHYLGKI